MTKEKMDALMKRYRADTLEGLVEALAHDVECLRENELIERRDAREALADAVAAAEARERTGEPYGTY